MAQLICTALFIIAGALSIGVLAWAWRQFWQSYAVLNREINRCNGEWQ